MAAASIVMSGCAAKSAVKISVSVVAKFPKSGYSSPADSRASRSREVKSWVLVMLPLWDSARCPVAVARKVGCALSQQLDPVVL